MPARRFFPALCLLLLLAGGAVAPQLWGRADWRVACWNVENLFDTVPAPAHDDADFTPQGACRWDGDRYWSKLGRLARHIAALGGVQPCALVGLVEVENDSVVRDLTRRTSLARLGYEALMTHGPDQRGINVALLYQPLLFRPVGHDSLRVPPLQGQRPTRDILHVWGELPTADTLDLFVVHLPSRRGGRAASRYRQRVAEALQQCADSLQRVRRQPLVLMMGDFNATAADPVLARTLAGYAVLTDTLAGTYNYQGEWSQIDHFLANPALVSRLRPSASVAAMPSLLGNTDRGPVPRRTFLGPTYQGGLSDHLPIVLQLHSSPAE